MLIGEKISVDGKVQSFDQFEYNLQHIKRTIKYYNQKDSNLPNEVIQLLDRQNQNKVISQENIFKDTDGRVLRSEKSVDGKLVQKTQFNYLQGTPPKLMSKRVIDYDANGKPFMSMTYRPDSSISSQIFYRDGKELFEILPSYGMSNISNDHFKILVHGSRVIKNIVSDLQEVVKRSESANRSNEIGQAVDLITYKILQTINPGPQLQLEKLEGYAKVKQKIVDKLSKETELSPANECALLSNLLQNIAAQK